MFSHRDDVPMMRALPRDFVRRTVHADEAPPIWVEKCSRRLMRLRLIMTISFRAAIRAAIRALIARVSVSGATLHGPQTGTR